MKIGILGGTFDPIHRGHLALAHYARKQFKLDQVFFIISARPPHKKNLRRFLTPAKHRLAMVELAVGKRRGFEVSDMEVRRKGLSYTVDTLKEIRKKYPAAALYLILGQDSYDGLHRWRKSGEIRKRVHLLVARRSGNLEIFPKRKNVSWIRMPLYPIASTDLRHAFERGADLTDYLAPQVIRYINAHGLYQRAS